MKSSTQLLSRCIGMILIIAFSCTYQFADAQWSSKSSSFSSPHRGIMEMIAVNSKVAWAIAYDGTNAFGTPINEFTRTTDGGQTWTSGSISNLPDDYLIGLAPVSASLAYASTLYTLDEGETFNGRILKTTDGGITWTQQTTADGTGIFFDDIWFFNANEGLVYGDQRDGYFTIYTTADGGNHWVRVPEANMPTDDPEENGYIFSGSAAGDTFWTVSTHGRVWKTSDKGLHWIANATDITEIDFSNIKMRDAMNGLWGVVDELYRTTDGGITWNEVTPSGTFFTNDLSYVPGTASTWVSTGGDVNSEYGALHGIGSSYSLDDGNTWITIDTGVDHLAVDMVNSYTGFCGGFSRASGKAGVFTYNGSALGYSCGNNMTEMCVSGNSYCVPHKAIKSLLNHGGSLGECSGFNRAANYKESQTITSYPNPFSPDQSGFTTISFSLLQSEKVSMQIFDVEGRLIRTLADDAMIAGTHELTWDGRDANGNAMSAGIYLLRIESQNHSETIRLSVMK